MGYWFVLVRVIKFGNHPGLMDSTLRVVKGKRQGGGAGGGIDQPRSQVLPPP